MDWQKPFLLKICKGDSEYTLSYSAMSYCQKVSKEGANSKLCALANSMKALSSAANTYDSWEICIIDDLPDEVYATENNASVSLNINATGVDSYKWYKVKDGNYNDWEYVGAGKRCAFAKCSYSSNGADEIYKCVLTNDKGKSVESNWVTIKWGGYNTINANYYPKLYFDVANSRLVLENLDSNCTYTASAYCSGNSESIQCKFESNEDGKAYSYDVNRISKNGLYKVTLSIKYPNNEYIYLYDLCEFEVKNENKLLPPTNIKKNGKTITWDKVEGADQYYVETWLYKDMQSYYGTEKACYDYVLLKETVTGTNYMVNPDDLPISADEIIGCRIQSITNNLSIASSGELSDYTAFKTMNIESNSIFVYLDGSETLKTGESVNVIYRLSPQISTDIIQLEYAMSEQGVVDITNNVITAIKPGEVTITVTPYVVDEQGTKKRSFDAQELNIEVVAENPTETIDENIVRLDLNASNATIINRSNPIPANKIEAVYDISGYNEKTLDSYFAAKDGYVFDGWYLDEKFTKPYEFSQDHKGKRIALYAKFVDPEDYYTLTYVADEPVLFDFNNKLQSTISIKVPVGEKAGPVYLSKDAIGRKGIKVESAKGYINFDQIKKKYSNELIYDGVIDKDTIVKIETFNGYSVTYNANGGAFADGSQTKDVNTNGYGFKAGRGIANPVSASGATFLGWYEDDKCTLRVDDEKVYYEDMTFYAQYSDMLQNQKTTVPRFNGRYVNADGYLLENQVYVLWIENQNGDRVCSFYDTCHGSGFSYFAICADLSEKIDKAGDYSLYAKIATSAGNYTKDENTYSTTIRVGENRLAKPENIRIDDGKIVWDEVEGAKKYLVVIKKAADPVYVSKKYLLETNSFESPYGDITKYAVEIRAYPDEDSDYYPSEYVYYEYTESDSNVDGTITVE